MIQRIQTIFLFLAALAAGALFLLPTATTDEPVASSYLFSDGQFTATDDLIIIISIAAAAILWLLDIFVFRNRPLQIKLSLVAMLFLFAGIGYGIYIFVQDRAMEHADMYVGIGLPLVAVIFAGLANRYIRSDEKLVRSADRLR